ncbi:MAG: outer membrane protein assembly factor BamA, partial [Muribaculaceae bacterium]|nr:outer membrane protein assembly factor BamA [Muribaculaceae bacterium]
MNFSLKILLTLTLLVTALTGRALDIDPAQDTIHNPNVVYTLMPKTYEIAGIKVSGLPNGSDDYYVIGYTGLTIGDKVEVPGTAITNAVKRLYRQGLYSSVQIKAEKIVGDKVWLEIFLRQQPRLSTLEFRGVKGGEIKDLKERLNMPDGYQLTPNGIARAKQIVEKYFAAKGFKNAKVNVIQQPDLSKENQVILIFDVNRSNKVKVHKIYVEGNEVLSDAAVKRAMKKTNENGNILNLFKQKKFVEQDYADDRQRIIQRYNELGYRDARIVSDTVVQYSDDRVDVHIKVDEGQRYYISDISWVGNTVYPTEVLQELLGIYPGEVYNQKRLIKRTQEDDDAVANLYMDNGYL